MPLPGHLPNPKFSPTEATVTSLTPLEVGTEPGLQGSLEQVLVESRLPLRGCLDRSPARQEAAGTNQASVPAAWRLLQSGHAAGGVISCPRLGLQSGPGYPSPEGRPGALRGYVSVLAEDGLRLCFPLTCAGTEGGAEPPPLWSGPELQRSRLCPRPPSLVWRPTVDGRGHVHSSSALLPRGESGPE